MDGCGATDNTAQIEVDVLPDGSRPSGTIPLRAAMNPDTLPSALLRYGTETVTGGTVTIDSISDQFVRGELDGTTNVGPLMATFTAPLCN